jgi:uncharacterized protein
VNERSPVSDHRDGATIEVYVQPRASRSEILGIHDGALRVRIAAPPVDGAANAEVIALLAKALGVPRSRVELLSGQTSRRKRMLIHGMTDADIHVTLIARP